MSDEPLKPCPWCGREPSVHRYLTLTGVSDDRAEYEAACDAGDHVVSGPWRKTKRGAIRAWNERRDK